MEKKFNEMCEVARRCYSIDQQMYPKYNVKRGLRNADGTGVLVGLTRIGDVHGYTIEDNDRLPDEGVLRYRGINVKEIIENCEQENRHGFEEVCYLLLFGKLPTKKQLEGFNEVIGEYRALPEGFTEDMILKAPSQDIMNKIARSVLAAYSYDNDPDSTTLENMIRQSIELIARIPTMAAYAYQAKAHYFENKSLFIHTPQKGLSTAENLLYMMRPDNKFTDLEADVLDTSLILHAEHGGGNNSAFTAHVVSSSGTDTYSAIAAAIGSLKGPKHGGANNRVRGMIEDFKANISDISDRDMVRDYIAKTLKGQTFDGSGLVYGMGHAIYTLSDPRAVMLKKQARELAEEKGYEKLFGLYNLIEELTPEVFAEIKGANKPLCANVDLYSGLVYEMLDIPPVLFTPIFAISRMAGWCAHRIEEVIAGGRIIRPAYKSVETKMPYTTLNERD